MLRRLALSLVFILLVSAGVEAAPSSSLVISEIKVAGDEWVELTNIGYIDAGIGWKIQYRSASGSSWSSKVTLDRNLLPGEVVSFPASSLADTAGHVQLVDDALQTIDTVSWGVSLDGVTETKHLPAPDSTQSLKRFWDEETAEFIDTDNNTEDFFVSYLPSPNSSDLHSNQDYPVIEISEVLPDPDTSTTYNDEFIELYNPNETEVNLTGYTLHVGSGIFVLNGLGMLPGEYLALPKSYDPTDLTKLYTNLNLTASSGVVSLQTPNGKYRNELAYTAGKKGLSYGVFADGPAWTELPTPGAENELVVTEKTSTSSSSSLKPCRSDQYRNSETNRCKLKSSATTSLKPCASNQYRNPETNRCRLISTASTSLKPCASNQYRNPETNRCRKIESATSTLKACAANQERNPETNRCRLKRESNATSSSTEAVKSLEKSSKSLPLVGIIGSGALMYGLYEWRYDVRNFFNRTRGYLGFRRGSGRDP